MARLDMSCMMVFVSCLFESVVGFLSVFFGAEFNVEEKEKISRSSYLSMPSCSFLLFIFMRGAALFWALMFYSAVVALRARSRECLFIYMLL